MKYFVGNWKMFGIPSSITILKRINSYILRDKNSKKYKILVAPPHTLLKLFSDYFKGKKIIIGSQNCYHKDLYSSNTGSLSPFMLKKAGAFFTLVGHSDNRQEGESNSIIKDKVLFSQKNNLNVVFCIGENKLQKKRGLTFKVLKKQIHQSLTPKLKVNKIIIAYEPIWSIGTGKIPKKEDLEKTIKKIKDILKKFFKSKISPKVLYGGSVDGETIKIFKHINDLDGFLIGGASKSSKKYIDIIKNYYR